MYSLFLLYIQVCNLFQFLFTVTFDFTLNFSAVVFNSLFSKSFEDLDVLLFSWISCISIAPSVEDRNETPLIHWTLFDLTSFYQLNVLSCAVLLYIMMLAQNHSPNIKLIFSHVLALTQSLVIKTFQLNFQFYIYQTRVWRYKWSNQNFL